MSNIIFTSKNTGTMGGVALIFIFWLSCLQVKAQSYTVGVPVCDTLCGESYAAACSKDFLAMALDSTLIPYVTGLDFQVKITAVNGQVSSNVSDTVKAGDIFPLPTSSESGSLVINLPKENNSLKFIVRIIGTPLVAGEKYYCHPTYVQTTMACQNGLTILALPPRDTCTVQSHPNSVAYNGDLPTPARYELKSNYPNPFNPETAIEYALPKAAFVKLKIYDVLGQEVRTLVNEFQQAGVKSIAWDGKNDRGQPVPSGVYIYRIVAGEFTKSLKSILLK